MPQHPSEFDDFQSDYDKVNWIDTPTHTKRKIYDKSFWIVSPNKNFSIRMGETAPQLHCFLKTAGEQFGDAITPLNIDDYTVLFRCVDGSGNIIINSPAQITNTSIGEITYTFTALDFPKPGRYYGEFQFKVDTSTFTLPPPSQRIEIIVT